MIKFNELSNIELSEESSSNSDKLLDLYNVEPIKSSNSSCSNLSPE